jgi:hypothetical protein
MEATMQRVLIMILSMILLTAGAINADVEQYKGPYGLTALIIERDGRKLLAWKLPHQSAKLLFLGSIYDGNEDLTWKYGIKYLGASRLKNDAMGIEQRTGDPGRSLYIFFDPTCESCKLLYERLQSEPIQDACLIWVPICLGDDEFANEQGAQWLMTSMPQFKTKWALFNQPSSKEKQMGQVTYEQVTQSNYSLLRWLKGNDDTVSVPCFAWVDESGVQMRSGNEMADGFEDVLNYLKEANHEGN